MDPLRLDRGKHDQLRLQKCGQKHDVCLLGNAAENIRGFTVPSSVKQVRAIDALQAQMRVGLGFEALRLAADADAGELHKDEAHDM